MTALGLDRFRMIADGPDDQQPILSVKVSTTKGKSRKERDKITPLKPLDSTRHGRSSERNTWRIVAPV